MRPPLLLLCVALACTSAKERERPGGSETSSSATAPATAAPDLAVAPVAASPANAGSSPAASAAVPAQAAAADRTGAAAGAAALTASEAAASYAKAQPGSGGDAQPARASAAAEDNSCASDADCGFTRIDAGACCPMRCSPRVVSKKQADALQAHVNACRKGRVCPEPMCRPPPVSLSPACVAHQCVGKPSRSPRADD